MFRLECSTLSLQFLFSFVPLSLVVMVLAIVVIVCVRHSLWLSLSNPRPLYNPVRCLVTLQTTASFYLPSLWPPTLVNPEVSEFDTGQGKLWEIVLYL